MSELRSEQETATDRPDARRLGGSRHKNFRTLASIAAATLATVALVAAGTAPAQAGGGGLGIGDTTANDNDRGSNKSKSKSSKNAKYRRLWNKYSSRNKRWARNTSECESGGDPNAIGGGGIYRGAFQFLKSTWRASPRSPGGDPIRYPWKTQAVVAVELKKRDGAGHWPNCG